MIKTFQGIKKQTPAKSWWSKCVEKLYWEKFISKIVENVIKYKSSIPYLRAALWAEILTVFSNVTGKVFSNTFSVTPVS